MAEKRWTFRKRRKTPIDVGRYGTFDLGMREYAYLCDIRRYYDIGRAQVFDLVVSNEVPPHRQYNWLIKRSGSIRVYHEEPPRRKNGRIDTRKIAHHQTYGLYHSLQQFLSSLYLKGFRYIWIETRKGVAPKKTKR